MSELNPCKTCGHDQKLHIYLQDACRPGFLCPSLCGKFVPTKPQGLTTEQKLAIAVKALREIAENSWYKNAYIPADNAEIRHGIVFDRVNLVTAMARDVLEEISITERNENE